MPKRPNSFTLIELLVVIIIIGVLATLAFPNFNFIIEKTYDREAQIALRQIIAAQKVYRMEIGVFYPNITGADAAANLATINQGLKLRLPTESATRWNYTIITPGPAQGATPERNTCADATRINGPNARDWDMCENARDPS
jgi:prepilin-type N-terminal cleavage/methylation domain-containing protein